ncbi:LADA_0H18206g1_1 [Lachancea dasiensis]|uniref:LADA_0H18206g1_1 n=1 Tax=Lachancea dasiensis TaxID=1072105 RepID=A0A1G4K5U2_9SACH|nr:LADA_0H18206g1_1 [Lachancea dasiensis]
MADATKDSAITPNLVLTELRAPERFITAFLFNDSQLLVVKSRKLTILNFPEDSEPSLYHSVATGTILGAWLCQDLVSRCKYAFILLHSGLLEVRDSRLEIVSTCQLPHFPRVSRGKILASVDAKFNRFFISWDTVSVHKLDYELGPSKFKFLKNKKQWKAVITSRNPILDFGLCHLEDEDYQESCHICLVSQSPNDEVPFVEVWKEEDVIRNHWQIFLQPKELGIKCDGSYGVAVISRNYYGFICLFADHTVFCRPRFMNGSQSLNYTMREGGALSFARVITSDTKFFVRSTDNEGEIDLLVCTSRAEFFKLALPPSIEGSDWPDFIPTDCKGFNRGEADTINGFVHLTGSRFLLSTNNDGLLILEADGTAKYFDDCHSGSVLRSSISNGDKDFRRLLISGGSGGNGGFLEITRLSFNKALELEPIITSIEKMPSDFWLTKQGIYWVSDGELFYQYGTVETSGSTVYVGFDGNIVSGCRDICLAAPVLGSADENLMFLKKDGSVFWSASHQRSRVPAFKSITSVKYVASCAKLQSTETLSVVAWGSNSVWFFDTKCITIELRGLSQVTSCLVKTFGANVRVIFSDVNGTVHAYNLDGSLCASFQVDGQKVSLHDFPDSERFFACSRDLLILINVFGPELDAAEVDLPLPISQIKVASASKVIIVGYDSTIYQASIEYLATDRPRLNTKCLRSKTHSFTNHLTLSLSHRFVIVSALATYYDIKLEKEVFDSELQVYDMMTQQMKACVAISKLHPQAHVSSMIEVTFHKKALWKKYVDTETSYAKQLVFRKCFLVSLNFEFAENELGDNLLLFALDERTGEVELQLKARVSFNVTHLFNYYNRLLIALGDQVQVLQLSYSAKDGSFSLQQISEPLTLDSFVSDCFSMPQAISSVNLESAEFKKRRLLGSTEKIGIHNLFKGIQELNLTCQVAAETDDGILASKLQKVIIEPARVSDYSEGTKALSEIRFSSSTKVGFVEYREELSGVFAAALDERGQASVLYKTSASEGLIGAQFEIPHPLSGIELVGLKLDKATIGVSLNHRINQRYASLHQIFKPMFMLNTSDGGCYLVSTTMSPNSFESFTTPTPSNLVAPLNCEEILFFESTHPLALKALGCLFG